MSIAALKKRLLDDTAECAFCPNLCLHACPVATAEGSTAAAPWGLMGLARALASGDVSPSQDTARSLMACTGCGACTDACLHERPVARVLRAVREALHEEVGPALQLPEPPVEAAADAVLPAGVSGAALLAAGDTARFTRVAQAAAQRWAAREELIFESAHDLDCVLEAYPRVGVTVKPPAVLAFQRRDLASVGGPVAWFESCTVSRSAHLDRHALRAHLESRYGGGVLAMRWQGRSATCCGAGGCYPVSSPDGARVAAERILDEAVRIGATTVVTPCGGCAKHLAGSVGDRPLVVLTGGVRG